MSLPIAPKSTVQRHFSQNWVGGRSFREGRCWHARIFYIRCRFGTGAILCVPILKEHLGHLDGVIEIVPRAERKREIHGRDDAGSSQLDEPWMNSDDTSRLASGSAGHGSC